VISKALAPPSLTWRWAIVVTLGFAVLHGPHVASKYEPNTWLERDGSFYFTTLLAIAEHGRIEQRALQPESWYTQPLGWNRELPEDWSNVAQGRGDAWYPKHAILLPLAAVPFFLLLGTIGTLVVNVLLNLLFVLLIFLLARRVARIEIAAALAILVSALPFVQLMSYGFSNDLLGADLALGALEATLAGSFATAGVLAGFAIWSRLTNLAFVPGLVLVGWDSGGRRGVTRALLASLVPLGLLGAFDTWAFGAPWITSYQRVLVRARGVAQVASHVRAFNVPWSRGLHRVTFEPDGAFATFPLLLPGLLGLLVVAWRRTLLAAGLFLFCLLPALAVATYDWYRPHFLLAVFGASVFGLAAVLGALIPPEPVSGPRPLSPRLRRVIAGTLGAALLAAVVIRVATRPDARLLSSHIEEARVFLDEIPCDYWNPQRERWECSHLDPEFWAMTGRFLGEPARIHGEPRRGISLAPSPTRHWRRLVFPTLAGKSVDLDLALGDDARPGPVEIEILPRGGEALTATVAGPGGEQQLHANLGEGSGPALEIRVRAENPQGKPLVVEGTVGP